MLVGIYISFVGIVVGVFQGILLRPITVRLNAAYPNSFEIKLMLVPLLVSTLHFAIVGVVSKGVLLFPLLLMSGIGSFCLPVLRGVVLRTQRAENFGAVNSLFSTIGVVSSISGNIVYPRVLKSSQEGTGFGAMLGDGGLNYVAAAIMSLSFFAALRATRLYNPADTGNLAKGGGDNKAAAVDEINCNELL